MRGQVKERRQIGDPPVEKDRVAEAHIERARAIRIGGMNRDRLDFRGKAVDRLEDGFAADHLVHVDERAIRIPAQRIPGLHAGFDDPVSGSRLRLRARCQDLRPLCADVRYADVQCVVTVIEIALIAAPGVITAGCAFEQSQHAAPDRAIRNHACQRRHARASTVGNAPGPAARLGHDCFGDTCVAKQALVERSRASQIAHADRDELDF